MVAADHDALSAARTAGHSDAAAAAVANGAALQHRLRPEPVGNRDDPAFPVADADLAKDGYHPREHECACHSILNERWMGTDNATGGDGHPDHDGPVRCLARGRD